METYEHTVEIDAYISATIKIPKVMTAEDLKALTSKANKLFNLAEVQIRDPKQVKTRSPYIQLTKEQQVSLVTKWSKASNEEKEKLAKEFGFASRKQADSRVYYYKNVAGKGTKTKKVTSQ